MLRLFRLLFIAVLLPIAACAKPSSSTSETPTNFEAGKDYKIISNSLIIPKQAPQERVKVVEFFSYGCPACNHFEPLLEEWLKNGKSEYVDFERVPVVFEQGWAQLAQAYYVAKNLGVETKLSPIIFKAIHQEGQDLTNLKNLEALFVKNGVNQKDFESAYNFSPGIDAQMMRGNTLINDYSIAEVPTLVVNGMYKVSPAMVGGDGKRFLQVVNYLTEKVHKGDK